MEGFFGRDLANVRIHDGAEAARSADSVAARAYTVGRDIVFADGAFAPETRAGQSLLAHELTHTLQPAGSGRGAGDGMRVSDPGDPDELEAAAVARQFDAGQAQASLTGGLHREPDPTQLSRCTQVRRAVGFEFETGWKVTNGGEALHKKDPIGPVWDGFKLEADEAGGGESEVEFIVHPPIAEGAVGFARLDDVMTRLMLLGTAMEGAAALNNGAPFTMDAASHRGADAAFSITPTNTRRLTAGAQVTTGLDLSKIGQLNSLDKPASTDLERSGVIPDEGPRPIPVELKRTMETLSARANTIQPTALIPEPSRALQGLLAVIALYLNSGADANKGEDLSTEQRHLLALNYPKRIADVLLARTNFAVLFGLLPRGEQKRLKETPDGWIEIVLRNTTPQLGLLSGDSVISRGIQNDEDDPTAGLTVPALTIGAWLRGMLFDPVLGPGSAGVDLLTGVADAESMGEFDRTESIGEAGDLFKPADAGIFEFRGAQTIQIPLARWGDFAREFHRYISHVHTS